MARVSVSHLRRNLPASLKRVQAGEPIQVTSHGRVMRTIWGTPILLFWANDPARPSPRAAEAPEQGRTQGQLAIADISLWELALLHERGRLVLPQRVPPALDPTRSTASSAPRPCRTVRP